MFTALYDESLSTFSAFMFFPLLSCHCHHHNYLPLKNPKSYMHAPITVQNLVNKRESLQFEELYSLEIDKTNHFPHTEKGQCSLFFSLMLFLVLLLFSTSFCLIFNFTFHYCEVLTCNFIAQYTAIELLNTYLRVYIVRVSVLH